MNCKAIVISAVTYTFMLASLSSGATGDSASYGIYPCGPVAVYVVFSYVGIDRDFDSILLQMGNESRQSHSMAEVSSALNAKGIDNGCFRLSKAQLINALKKRTHIFILPVKRNSQSVNHCITILERRDNLLVSVQYPEGRVDFDADNLDEVWEGDAIAIPILAPEGNSVILSRVVPSMIIFALLSFAGWWTLRRRTRGISHDGVVFSRRGGVKIDHILALVFATGSLFGYFSGFSTFALGEDIVESTIEAVNILDLGSVSSEEVLIKEIPLINRSNHAVPISKATVSCGGCLKVLYLPKRVEANQTANIRIEINYNRKVGPVSQWIKIDSVNSRPIIVRINAIVRGLRVVPDRLNFGNISDVANVAREVHVEAFGYEMLEVDDVETGDEMFFADFGREAQVSDGVIRRAIVFSMKHVLGVVGPQFTTATIHVKLDIEDRIMTLPIQAYVLGELEPTPSHVFFGTMSSQENGEASCKIQLKGRSVDELEVMEESGITGTVLGLGSGDIAEVRVALSPQSDKRGVLTGAITIRDKRHCRILASIPWTAVISSSSN